MGNLRENLNQSLKKLLTTETPKTEEISDAQVLEIETMEQIQVSEEKKENLETSDIQVETAEIKPVQTKQDRKQKRIPKGKRISENERKSESESFPDNEPENVSEQTEVKAMESQSTVVESEIDIIDDIIQMKEPEAPTDDLDLVIPIEKKKETVVKQERNKSGNYRKAKENLNLREN